MTNVGKERLSMLYEKHFHKMYSTRGHVCPVAARSTTDQEVPEWELVP